MSCHPYAALASRRLLPVLRTPGRATPARRTETLLVAGCRVVELTTTTPGWAEAVARTVPLADAHGRPALIGVGTVTTAGQAETALNAAAAAGAAGARTAPARRHRGRRAERSAAEQGRRTRRGHRAHMPGPPPPRRLCSLTTPGGDRELSTGARTAPVPPLSPGHVAAWRDVLTGAKALIGSVDHRRPVGGRRRGRGGRRRDRAPGRRARLTAALAAVHRRRRASADTRP